MSARTIDEAAQRDGGGATARTVVTPAVTMGRREFIGSVALISGGIAASAVVPWSNAAQTGAAAVPNPQLLTDWTVDDMWGVYPRYADPIGYGHAQTEAVAAAEPLSSLFYA